MLERIDKSKESRRVLIYSLIIFFVVVLVFPIVTMFSKAFYLDGKFVGINNFIEYFKTPALSQSISNSIWVSTVVAIICVVVAFVFAYGIERSNIKFKNWVHFIAMMPLLIPTMTHAIALIYLLGENGLLTTGFFGNIPWMAFSFPLYGKWGIVIAECLYVFPAIYMMFAIAFKMCDFRLYEAAEMFGTSKFRVFKTITLPSVKYTIISGFFSAFTMVFSDFGIPKVLGGNYNLLSTDIYKQVIGQSNITIGATVGILLVLPSVISFIVDRKYSKDVNSMDSNAKEFRVDEDRKRDVLCGSIIYLITGFIILIFLAIGLAAFTEQWPYKLNFTFKWFTMNSVGISPITMFLNTVFVSGISAVLGTILVILAAYVTQRGVGFEKLRKFIDWFSMLPLAVPGLVIGLSYLLFFNDASNPLKFIYGTFIIMIFANIIHFFSMPYITIKSSMKKIDSEYENVAETMGIPWYNVFDNVILELIKPAIIESFIYYFVNSMMTISALVFLYTTKTKIWAVEMVSAYDEGLIAQTAAIAIMIFITNLIVKYTVIFYSNKVKRDKDMRKIELNKVLQVINEKEDLSQRKISKLAEISLGKTNSIIKECIERKLVTKKEKGRSYKYEITDKGFELLRESLGVIKEEKIRITKLSNEKTKKAVILAAGNKKDFDIPVAALKVGEKTIIEQSIENLLSCGIEEISVVVGYGKDSIINLVQKYRGIEIIESRTYEGTGSMDSLALLNTKIEEDFILVEGDLVYDKALIEKIQKIQTRDCIITTELTDSGDEGYVQIKDGYLFKMGKDIHQFNRVDGEFIGVSKVSTKLFELIIREYKENMNPLLNYEYILLDVARDFKVPVCKIEGIEWGEVDNKQQYDILVTKKLNKKK
ncbi:MAG: ABC transporter permease subunit [Clostridium sp.]|uniref:ABC transporter permease subunit n=1 Tax=Clostridium sp. TaxID=1506 RepID=UPI003F389C31